MKYNWNCIMQWAVIGVLLYALLFMGGCRTMQALNEDTKAVMQS